MSADRGALMAALLALQDVSKAFGSLRVIDGLTLAVGEREALGVIGPNGAGKTTALNLMIGRLRPERGAVRLRGPRHHERCRRTRAAAPASRSPTRSRIRSTR